jgi:hypothetical protein
MSVFNPERAARVLLDALALGDGAAAEKWKVTVRTVENYRARLLTDVHFSALFESLKRKEDGAWRMVRLRFLRKTIAKLETLVDQADSPKYIRDVADAVKVIGELQIASDALGVDLNADAPGESPAAPEGGAGSSPGGASGGAPSVH